mmetsp:Transcript_8415/g.15881  ORF Transcript_8415/g.15881 Transcript_8415/m.15881 type:complete len:302 (+) Transcript_8415:98-1003(+)
MLKFDSACRHVRVKSKILARRYNHSFESKLIDMKQLCSKSTQQEIADALRPHFENQYPLLLKWPNIDSDAVRCWKSLDYLRMKVGEDAPCTVEIGGSYTNPDMERPEITFGDYILYMKLFHEQYGEEGSRRSNENEPDAKNLVYLAQNDLFSPLHLDFDVPDLCQDPSFQVGNGRIYSTMFWFGPRGCVSPLHYDPLDNLLMQFVGRKNVVLFPPMRLKDTPPVVDDDDVDWHYAGHDGQQYNTSPVDIINPDIEKYPLFKKAPMAIECQIEPGDILYIPSKWWHHVTSLDTTISVNVWWR